MKDLGLKSIFDAIETSINNGGEKTLLNESNDNKSPSQLEYDKLLPRYKELKSKKDRSKSEQFEYEKLDQRLEDLSDKIRGEKGSGGLNESKENKFQKLSSILAEKFEQLDESSHQDVIEAYKEEIKKLEKKMRSPNYDKRHAEDDKEEIKSYKQTLEHLKTLKEEQLNEASIAVNLSAYKEYFEKKPLELFKALEVMNTKTKELQDFVTFDT